MTPYLQQLHTAHKERMARLSPRPAPIPPPPPAIEAAIVLPPAPPMWEPKGKPLEFRGRITVAQIQYAVAKEFEITMDEIRGARRVHKYVHPRHRAQRDAKDAREARGRARIRRQGRGHQGGSDRSRRENAMTTIRVIDVETCGLPPDNAQIVELATVDLVLKPREAEDDHDTWARGRMWSTLVNPGRFIPAEAMAVHHITNDMVRGAPTFPDAIAGVMEGFNREEFVFAAHNMRFEQECLTLNGASAEIASEFSWLCSYKVAVLQWPDAPSHKNQVLRYWLDLKFAPPTSSATLPELFQPHRALGDAYVTAALIRRELLVASVADMIEASAHPVLLPRLHFGEHAGKPIAEVPTSYLEWIAHKSKGPWDPVAMAVVYTLAAVRAFFVLQAQTKRGGCKLNQWTAFWLGMFWPFAVVIAGLCVVLADEVTIGFHKDKAP